MSIFAGLNCLTKLNSSREIDLIDFSFFYALCHTFMHFFIRLYTLSFIYALRLLCTCDSAIYFVIRLLSFIDLEQEEFDEVLPPIDVSFAIRTLDACVCYNISTTLLMSQEYCLQLE